MAYNLGIFVGGTGGRVLEAATFLIAANFLGSHDPIDLVIVDKDSRCGNTTSAKTTVNRYSVISDGLTGLSVSKAFTPSNLITKSWDFDRALKRLTNDENNIKLINTVKSEVSDEELLDALYSKEEQQQDTTKGFYGHPSIGALLYDFIMTTPDVFIDDFDFFSEVVRNLQQNKEVRVFLVGSIFGGTGASVFSNIAKSIREKAEENQLGIENLKISGALLLPYFGVPQALIEIDGINSIVIDGNKFMKKSRVALNQYGTDKVLMRSVENNKKWVFDSLYIMGNHPLSCTSEMNCDGGEDQKNHFHIVDFFAALSMCHFFDMKNDDFNPIEGTNNVFVPTLFNGDGELNAITWDNIPNGSKEKIVTMLRFCAYVVTTMQSPFLLSTEEKERAKIPMSKRLFGHKLTGKSKATPEQYSAMKVFSESVYDFCKSFLNFIYDISLSGKNWADPQHGEAQTSLLDCGYLQRLIDVCGLMERARTSNTNETSISAVTNQIESLNTCYEIVVGQSIGIDNSHIDNLMENEFGNAYAGENSDKSAFERSAFYVNKIYELCAQF